MRMRVDHQDILRPLFLQKCIPEPVADPRRKSLPARKRLLTHRSFRKHTDQVVSGDPVFFFLRKIRPGKRGLRCPSVCPEPGTVNQAVRTGLIVAVGSVALLFIIKAVARIIVPTSFRPDRPFLDVRLFGIPQIVYILTAGIQEFLARSVVQGNLMRIIVGKYTAAKAIALSSVIFAALHIHLGFIFMIGAAILAGLEGILYEKQRNIFGVWIVHWVFGVFGTMLSLIDH